MDEIYMAMREESREGWPEPPYVDEMRQAEQQRQRDNDDAHRE